MPPMARARPRAFLRLGNDSHFRRVIKADGVKKIGVHGMRHTCATLLLGAGEPVKDVATDSGMRSRPSRSTTTRTRRQGAAERGWTAGSRRCPAATSANTLLTNEAKRAPTRPKEQRANALRPHETYLLQNVYIDPSAVGVQIVPS